MSPENVRPWGWYDIIDEDAGFKIKRITVNPRGRLSYQSHGRREEVWVLVSGRALFTLDGAKSEMARGDMVRIPVGAKHRIENAGDEPVVFVEVQMGDYLGEDDIERFEDDYGRA